MKTIDDLKAAFAGESQANRKYIAFSKKADEEGYLQIARLFRAAAHAETVHALNHFKALDEVKDTASNLQAAIAGEHYEVVTIYPDFLKDAENEQNKKAINSFKWAWEAEKVHELLYTRALESLGTMKEEEFDYYVCPVCGHTHERNAPEKCPICGTPGRKFEKIS